jgi:hypothetical protein
MMGHIDNLCEPTNTNRFTCAGAKVNYSASLVWGTIGPRRLFQAGQTYNVLLYFFLIGVSTKPTHPFHETAGGLKLNLCCQPVVTVLVYLLYRRYPNSWVRYINVPIFFNAAGNIPPANTGKRFMMRPIKHDHTITNPGKQRNTRSGSSSASSSTT